MKDIRIFIASSKELNPERNELAFLVLAKEEEFEKRGLRVRLSKWEYVDPKMTAGRTEDRYLDEMYACDAALVIFRDIAGKYTREELEKALAREKAGTDRLKTHRILFCADGAPDSDAAALRASLPEGSYGVYADMDGLKSAFLSLVDEVAASDRLEDAPDGGLRPVTAFLAVDDELAADRNAFADTILNLNDILARRGVRVRMRFYDPSRHRELLESSEMALVLYHTNCRAFGPEQMNDAYDRTKREENPKRLYVFFRDEEEEKLDKAFVDFRNGFADNLGHFFCRFENADTLKLNFLLSLESALGEGESFVKLDGRKVKADELDVAEITRLPMVANNGGLNDLLAEAEEVAAAFDRQRQVCRENPEDALAYQKLLSLSTRKNDLESQVNKELSRSFDLAKRMAAISAKEANDTIARARSLLDRGRIEEAVQLLDGASSEIDDVLGDIGGLEDLMEQKFKALEAWIDVELFRADTVLAFAREPFAARFAKAEQIFKALLLKAEKALMKNRPLTLAKVLRRFAKLYDEVGDTQSPVPLLEKALKLYQAVEMFEPGSCSKDRAEVGMLLANKERLINRLDAARDHYETALAVFRRCGSDVAPLLAECLLGIGRLHNDINELVAAESEYGEALEVYRGLAKENPTKFDCKVATTLRVLAKLHASINQTADAEREYAEALEIDRHLAGENPEKFSRGVAATLKDFADLHKSLNRVADAEREYAEALEIERRLAEENPAKYDPDVALILASLGGLHLRRNRLENAEKMYGEALGLFRHLSLRDPAYYLQVAGTLNDMSSLCLRQNRFAAADKNYVEALDIWRRLALDNPAKFNWFVAAALHNLANLHKSLNRLSDAEREYAEALEIWRCLAGKNPAKFECYVAQTLASLGDLYVSQNRLDAAEERYAESLEIRRRLAQANPAKFESAVASTLNRIAGLHRDCGKWEQAIAEYEEALALRRALAESNPEKYRDDVAETLTGFAVLHAAQGGIDTATAAFDEALRIRMELATAHSGKYNEGLAETLHEQGRFFIAKGDRAQAIATLERAAAIRRDLAAACPEKYGRVLDKTLALLASLTALV